MDAEQVFDQHLRDSRMPLKSHAAIIGLRIVPVPERYTPPPMSDDEIEARLTEPGLFAPLRDVRSPGVPACRGPCDQGRLPCPSADACRLPDNGVGWRFLVAAGLGRAASRLAAWLDKQGDRFDRMPAPARVLVIALAVPAAVACIGVVAVLW